MKSNSKGKFCDEMVF